MSNTQTSESVSANTPATSSTQVKKAPCGLAGLWRRVFRRPKPETVEETEEQKPPSRAKISEMTDAVALAEHMFACGRYTLLLRPQIIGQLNDDQKVRVIEMLEDRMALVPEGEVVLGDIDEALEDGRLEAEELASCSNTVVRVEPLYMDRYAVSNEQYYQFVAAGGYEQMGIWDPEIWPAIMEFVDQTGEPGPHFWKNGKYPNGLKDHPVVGVCWFEAAAYARWIGKRLPTDAEWVKAGSWPVTLSDTARLQRRYPWGASMDEACANLWETGPDSTVSVFDYQKSESVGGLVQMVGNVWEWTTGNFGESDPRMGRCPLTVPMKSLRGGAFDTYFESQATCQFVSGDNPIVRKRNIGFRCSVGACDLDSSVFGELASVTELV